MKKKLTEARLKQLQDEIADILQNYDVTQGLGRVLRLLTKEASLCQNHLKGLQEWESKKNSYDTSKIQIGGGKHTLEGYLNIDIENQRVAGKKTFYKKQSEAILLEKSKKENYLAKSR